MAESFLDKNPVENLRDLFGAPPGERAIDKLGALSGKTELDDTDLKTLFSILPVGSTAKIIDFAKFKSAKILKEAEEKIQLLKRDADTPILESMVKSLTSKPLNPDGDRIVRELRKLKPKSG